MLQVQTQSFCNGQCPICPYHISSQILGNGTMEEDLFERIASELVSENQVCTLVFVLHNEPLIDKRLFDWIKHVKASSSETHCTIVTNGELLDSFVLAEMVQSGLDELIISLNAHTKEIYESMNAGLDFDKVMKNVHYVISDRHTK
ncbi:radical SAM protein [Chloroflexota bacterium]